MTDLSSIEGKVETLTRKLKEHHNQLESESTANRIIADRVRTVDQIKRLYAVIMAFALTTSIANAYLCERSLDAKTLASRLIIFGPVFCLGSILILFCLGAERYLDLKYVQLTGKAATWKALALDLATLGATAGVFVVLANSFQPPPTGGKLVDADLSRDQSVFLLGLIILCVVDVVCLALQYPRLRRCDTQASNGSLPSAYSAHRIWIQTNMAMCAIFIALYHFETFVTGVIGVVGIAVVLVIVHLGRFLIDFGCGFKLYFPPEEPPASGSLLKSWP